MRRWSHYKGYALLGVLAAMVLWMAAGSRAEDVVPIRRGGAVVHSIGEQKSDMARMVEAYERLSSQYLSMVQQNLAAMNDADQTILKKLETLEAKMDAMDKKLDVIVAQTAPPIKPQPLDTTEKLEKLGF